jgi:hypothetical protein
VGLHLDSLRQRRHDRVLRKQKYGDLNYLYKSLLGRISAILLINRDNLIRILDKEAHRNTQLYFFILNSQIY